MMSPSVDDVGLVRGNLGSFCSTIVKALVLSLIDDSLDETSGGEENKLLDPGSSRANSPVGRRLGITWRLEEIIWSLAEASLLLTSSNRLGAGGRWAGGGGAVVDVGSGNGVT